MTIHDWLDLAPQIIGIICLAIYSWRRMNYMSAHLSDNDQHLAAHDEHNITQDRHLRVLDVHTGLITPKKECTDEQ